ncbi:RNA polymerase sigma factor [Patescibacteria group bacterium]
MENEEVIVNNAKKDPEAFGRLYDMYYQPVFGFLLSRTGNVEIAKDLTSETFFQALKNICKYKYKGKPFKSWLFAIAVAQVGNYYRGRAKYITVLADECPELVAQDSYLSDYNIIKDEEDGEIKERVLKLRSLMKQLNQKQQTILTLRYFSHQTIPEISNVLKMKEGTVKSHIHRALKKLNVLMVEENEPNYESAKSAQNRRAFGISRI